MINNEDDIIAGLKVENKVCGSDGVTYMNECELRIASCRHQKIISVESRGACGKNLLVLR